MNLRVFFIYICKTAHFGWLRCAFRNIMTSIQMLKMRYFCSFS